MADTSVKLSGTYDSIEAYNIMLEMQNMSADYEAIRTEAAAAASTATAASTAATNAINVANTAVSNAQTYAGNANDSAGEAAGYASNADTSATNAASSATDASNSAAAAATSETNAAASASSAAASAAVVNGALPLSGGTMTGNITLADGGNPLSTAGGTMTGDILYNGLTNDVFHVGRTQGDGSYDIGWFNGNNGDGANIALRSAEFAGSGDAGEFILIAKSNSASKNFLGKPDGTLTWAGKNVLTDNVENVGITTAISFKSGYNERGGVLRIVGGTIVQLKLGFNITSSVTAGTVASIGTLASAYRPPNDAFGGSADGNLYVSNDGNMQFRFFSNKSAGSWAWCTVCYLLL